MKYFKPLLLILALLLPALLFAKPAAAQPTVLENEITVDYPQRATFTVTADAPLSAATLSYRLPQYSCVESVSEVPVEPAGSQASWTWVMNRSGNPPPGTRVEWTWTLTTADGATVTTAPQSYTFRDERFEWQRVGGDNLTLYWYDGAEVGPLLYEAAVAGLDQLQNDMGIELQQDVQIFIYGSAADMRDAVVYVQDWAGGVAFGEYGVILIGVPPSIAEDWGRRTVRHELAHLVLAQFGRSCVGGGRPTWLEEGLATYAEGAPDETTLADISRGVEEDAFFPVRSLAGAFPAHGGGASLAYSQSYSLVAYLLENDGQAQLQELILALAAGRSTDAALEAAYGVDTDGLETGWRSAVGAPERVPQPTPTPQTAAQVPTIVPLSGLEDVPTPPAGAAASAAAAETPPAETASETEDSGRFNCLFGLALPLTMALVTLRRRCHYA